MTNYNYFEAVKADVEQWIQDNMDLENDIITGEFADRDEIEDYLNDRLWTADSVTVTAIDTEDESAIDAIYKFFDNDNDYDFELYLDRETIYNTHPTTRAYINITTWADDDILEKAWDRVHYCMIKLDELTKGVTE